MTPQEFADWIEGVREREEAMWERAAWMISHQYAMHITKKGAKPPSVDKLLGRKRIPRA